MKKFYLRFIILLFCSIILSFQASAQNKRNKKFIDLTLEAETKGHKDKKKKNRKSKEEELLEILSKKDYNFKSIMFSTEEIDKIDEAINSFKSGNSLNIEGEELTENNQNTEELNSEKREKELSELNERSKIYLGSILYLSKNNWSIWLNNDKITSENNYKSNEFYVKNIDGKKVQILWSLSLSKWKILSDKSGDNNNPPTNSRNQVLVEFTLRPNQTFILRYNSVLEGKQHTIKTETENVNSEEVTK